MNVTMRVAAIELLSVTSPGKVEGLGMASGTQLSRKQSCQKNASQNKPFKLCPPS